MKEGHGLGTACDKRQGTEGKHSPMPPLPLPPLVFHITTILFTAADWMHSLTPRSALQFISVHQH